ncbi:MAG: ribosomal protein, partial [Pseudomonadota bacterium]
ASRAVRRAGKVPAVIYGGKEPPLPVSVDPLALNRQLHTGNFFTTMIELDIAGKGHKVLARDVQFHPVTDRPEHVDFLRVSADTLITVDVPVVFDNEAACPGIKRGGVLNVVRHTVELECRADSIPHSIHADLAELDIGDSLHISSIPLPAGVTPTITDRDFTVATIAAPTVVRDEALEAVAAAQAAQAAATEATAAAEGAAAPAEGAAPAAEKPEKK